MRKIWFVLAFLILIPTIVSVKNVGTYGSDFVILADGYVARVPRNLGDPVDINNHYKVTISPQILINGEIATYAPVINESHVLEPQDKYIFEAKAGNPDLDISERLEFASRQITSKVSFTNRGNKDAEISITYTLNFDKNTILFSPYFVDNSSTRYVVLANGNYYGNALGAVADFDILPPSSNFRMVNSWTFGTTIPKLKPGESVSLDVAFYPFNIQAGNETVYPKELSSFLEEPLIKVSGAATVSGITKNTEATQKFAQLIAQTDTTKKAPDGTFSLLHDVDITDAGLDSLGMSMYFKSMCIQVELPCRLIIGERGRALYAWIEAYTNKWEDLDVFSKLALTPAGYDVIYQEPQVEVRILPGADSFAESFYRGTNWLTAVSIGFGFLIYLVIAVIFAMMVFYLRKAVKRMTLYTGDEKVVKPEEMSGKYNILGKESKDPFSNDILQKVKEKNGEVDTKKLAEETGYSEELIKSGLSFLVDNNIIRLVGMIETPQPPREGNHKRLLQKSRLCNKNLRQKHVKNAALCNDLSDGNSCCLGRLFPVFQR